MKILDFMDEHPVLVVIALLLTFDFILHLVELFLKYGG